MEDGGVENGVLEFGDPSRYTCPECHGVLMQIKEGNHVRFRCHTGHAYSLDALLADLTKSIQDALWNTLRAIQESELLLKHLSEHLRSAGDVEAAEKCLTKMIATSRRADIVRQAAMEAEVLSVDRLDIENYANRNTE